MIIKNMELPKSRTHRGEGKRVDLDIPFSKMVVGDAYMVDLDAANSVSPYNLLKQRVYRANRNGKKFVSRMVEGTAYVFRTA